MLQNEKYLVSSTDRMPLLELAELKGNNQISHLSSNKMPKYQEGSEKDPSVCFCFWQLFLILRKQLLMINIVA